MQGVQNKAARIMTKTRLSDRRTSKFVNELAELIPINPLWTFFCRFLDHSLR